MVIESSCIPKNSLKRKSLKTIEIKMSVMFMKILLHQDTVNKMVLKAQDSDTYKQQKIFVANQVMSF